MAAVHGYLPAYVVRDQEGLIHKVALIPSHRADVHGKVTNLDTDEFDERDVCRLCWPSTTAPASADRSEAAG